jgi:hypothetical protein
LALTDLAFATRSSGGRFPPRKKTPAVGALLKREPFFPLLSQES